MCSMFNKPTTWPFRRIGVLNSALSPTNYLPGNPAALKLAFDPAGGLNPGKVIPTLNRCAEYGKMHVKKGLLPFPELERF